MKAPIEEAPVVSETAVCAKVNAKRPLSSSGRIARAMRAWAALWLAGAASAGSASAMATESAKGWWRDAVFYEIFVRSFADATSGPLAGDGIGDFQGLIEKLDYLNDGRGAKGSSLGITALWLMPIHPSPSYHGYDVSDYFAVHPEYGDIALFKRFLHEAHRRGIRVIIDSVLNHASSQHPLFVKALSEGSDGDTRRMFRFAELPLNLFGPWEQRTWHPAREDGSEFYYGVFSSEMPDWNFDDPRVTEHHRSAAAFWLKEVGVDGFRLDAVRYFHEIGRDLQDTKETRAWLKAFTDYCHSVKPRAFIIGENTARMDEVARSIRGGSVDSSFEFDLARATIESVRLRTPGILMRTLDGLRELYGDESPWATLLTNHDQERARTQLGDDEGLTRLATKLLFTLPGVPFAYYGEELGMQATKPDPDLRTPMPWTSEPPNAGFTRPDVRPWKAPKSDFREVNVAAQTARPESMWRLYQKLIALNLESPAIRKGRPLTIGCSDRQVYAAMRAEEGEAVLVIGNFSRQSRPSPRFDLDESPIRSAWTLNEVLEGAETTRPVLTSKGGFSGWSPLETLAPESIYVLRWRE